MSPACPAAPALAWRSRRFPVLAVCLLKGFVVETPKQPCRRAARLTPAGGLAQAAAAQYRRVHQNHTTLFSVALAPTSLRFLAIALGLPRSS